MIATIKITTLANQVSALMAEVGTLKALISGFVRGATEPHVVAEQGPVEEPAGASPATAPAAAATSINCFAVSKFPLWLTPASAIIKTLFFILLVLQDYQQISPHQVYSCALYSCALRSENRPIRRFESWPREVISVTSTPSTAFKRAPSVILL